MEVKNSDIQKTEKLADAIKNFKECYKDCNLYGGQDGYVDSGKLIEWITENPHMIQIASDIHEAAV
jgi:hypothetical protein